MKKGGWIQRAIRPTHPSSFIYSGPSGIVQFVGALEYLFIICSECSTLSTAEVLRGLEAETSGIATANTVNGSIRASIGEGDWEDGLEFRTVNGSIDLTMPGSVNANLKARSMNGQVNSDFPIRALMRPAMIPNGLYSSFTI